MRTAATAPRTASADKHDRDIAAVVASGHASLEAGRYAEAASQFKKVLAARPGDVEALQVLGAVALQLDRDGEALDYFDRALALHPAHPYALGNRGLALQKLRRLPEALASLERAIAAKADYLDAHYNLGLVHDEIGDIENAISAFSRAVALAPRDASAHNKLGNALQRADRHDEAAVHFATAVTFDPSNLPARINHLKALQQRCDWRETQAHAMYIRAVVRSGVSSDDRISPLHFAAIPGTTAAEQRLCAEAFAQHLACDPEPLIKPTRAAGDDRLRIGYISSDFGLHPVGHLVGHLLRLHDRSRFMITLYTYGADDQSMVRAENLRAADTCVDLNYLDDAAAAQRIRADGIDILVDLTGYTGSTRSAVLAHRAAPIQVNYLGFPGTMGAAFMDYIIADSFLIPPEAAPHYAEKLAYLPSYLITDPRWKATTAPTRAECGLPQRGFVFASFNQITKLTPDLYAIWMRLLSAVPESVLWLGAPDPPAIANLSATARAAGVDPARLVFAPQVRHTEHLGRLRHADLMLDTLYYNGGTTTVDALWAGVPVVTCAGTTYPSRVAGSLLTAHGVPELITDNLDDYYALALELATDAARYADTRSRVTAQRDTGLLFDSERTTRELERLYERLARTH